MSENTPENEAAAPVQEAAVTKDAGSMGSACNQGKDSPVPASEQTVAALLELAAHGDVASHAVRCFKTKAKKWAYEPSPQALTPGLLHKHLTADGPHLGVYPIAPGTATTRFAAFDLDDHDGATGWDVIAAAARRLVEALDVLCCKPLVFRSGGGDGIHVFLFWNVPQSAKDVRRLMKEVLDSAGFKVGTDGVGKGEIEIFPKQDSVKVGGRGNLIALPLARKSVALSSANLSETVDWSIRPAPPVSVLVKLADVRSALTAIKDDPHDRWINFALAIKREFADEVPDDGFGVWCEWSARNPDKFDERECDKRWRSLDPESDPEKAVTVASVYWTATNEYGWRAAKTKDKGGDDLLAKVQALLEGAVYCIGVKRFVDLASLVTYDKEQFSDRHAIDFPVGIRRPVASTIFINHPEAVKVHSPTYHPGRERFVTWEGLPRVNLWRPTTLVRFRGDVGPFLEHAAFLVPDEQERATVLDWMAYTVQHPEKKINWAIFLGGSQGIGKDTLFEPLIRAVGEHNTSIIKAENINGAFTDWLERKLIIVEEMAAFGKREMVNDIKPLLSAPPNKVRVNQKFERAYDVPNIGNFVFFSNQRDALPIDPEERRYFICWSMAEKRPPEYYTELHAWIEANSGAVFDWLMDRDVSNFQAQGRAPETEAKAAMVKDTRSPLEQHIAARIKEEALPFDRDIVTIEQVITALPSHIRNASDVKVANALKVCGAVKLQKQAQLPDRGGRPAVWVLRRAELYKEMTPSQLGKLLIGEAVDITEKDGDGEKVVRFRQPGSETVM